MTDHTSSTDQGSELNPRDERYLLPEIRVPTSIDGEPHEVAMTALVEFENVLAHLVPYGAGVENMVRAAMVSEALGLPDDEDPTSYPERTYELAAVIRVNRALRIAENLIEQAITELDKPVAESRRLDR